MYVYVYVSVYVNVYVYAYIVCTCICIWICVFVYLCICVIVYHCIVLYCILLYCIVLYCIKILAYLNTVDINPGKGFSIRQASGEEVSAVYKDLSPEAQANLKEALAALHKAWNRGDDHGMWSVGSQNFTTETGGGWWIHPATSSFPNQPENWSQKLGWRSKTVCLIGGEEKPPTRQCGWCNEQDFATKLSWNATFCIPSAFV